ncbi:MAG: DEAD/DEAH box helicase, partial [Rhodospirillales bacterium]|nr:DEAD/DEAH box helicase [Rhodospirillales bacterium]
MTQASSRSGVAATRMSQSPRAPAAQAPLPGLDAQPDRPGADPPGREFWIGRVRSALAERSSHAQAFAEEGLRAWPADPELLLLAALTALAAGLPERALALLKRYGKRYVPGKPVALLTALAIAQQGQFARAWTTLHAEGLETDRAARSWFVGDDVMADWLVASLRQIRLERSRPQEPTQARRRAAPPPVASRQPGSAAVLPPSARLAPARANGREVIPPLLPVADLPQLEARFDMAFELANADAIAIADTEATADFDAFRLRGELVRLSLFEGFDELLCLPALQGVEAHWYQVETVRKVLKQYRGRVLLADEVGLGKTVEAGMVLKEYLLRGMAERILILTPASLVGQWRDEMASKFGIDCATSHDPLLRSDPAAFWAQPRVIASIAAARRKEQADLLAGLGYDVVVVDEAHHLRDQASASYRLVNSLQKRFLLLLSATPVQNSLLELYNLLTLL